MLWAFNVALLLGSVVWIAADPVVARHLAFEQDRLALANRIVLHDLGHASVGADPVATESSHARALTVIVDQAGMVA